ncbi:MAG: alpha/beta hydrolase family protein [Clostridiales bacterium]|nr:alpha/beta hydrolase family protein [Clostridiales bacterium]
MYYNHMFFKDSSYKFIGDRINSHGLGMSFLNEKYNDIGEWKMELCNYINERLHYSPSVVPLNEEIVEEVDFGGYIRRKIYFDSALGCRIPAYLLVPKNLKDPAPAIVALHDHGAMFYWGKEKSVEHTNWNQALKNHIDSYYAGVPLASGLAKRGYVVLVIDSLFFGERRFKLEDYNGYFKERLERFEHESEEYIREYNIIEQEIESELVKAVFYAGYTFMGIRTWDDMASVSYLCSRPEVDPGRIGCIGLSMGGHRSGWLSAMDDRIKCAVVIGWMARYKEMVEQRLTNIAWMWAVPGLYENLDYPDVISLSVPKPLLIVHGSKDALFPDESGQKAIEVIRKVYNKADCGQNFTAEIYDAHHEFNAKMQKNAYSWLNKYLM